MILVKDEPDSEETDYQELEDIKNRINDISAKEWHLAKLMKFHKANFSTTTH